MQTTASFMNMAIPNFNKRKVPIISTIFLSLLLTGMKMGIVSAKVKDITDPNHPIVYQPSVCNPSWGATDLLEQSSLKKELEICIKTADVNVPRYRGVITSTTPFVITSSVPSPPVDAQFLLLSSITVPIPLRLVRNDGNDGSTAQFDLLQDIGTSISKTSKFFVAIGRNVQDHVAWTPAVEIPANIKDISAAFEGGNHSIKMQAVKAYRMDGIANDIWIASSKKSTWDSDGDMLTPSDASVDICASNKKTCSTLITASDLKCVAEINSLVGNFTIRKSSDIERWFLFDTVGCKYGNPTYVWLLYQPGHPTNPDSIGTFVYAGD